MDDLYFEVKQLLISFFENVAIVKGWIFEETWDPVFDNYWIIRFSNKANAKHYECRLNMNIVNILYHVSENDVFLSICLPIVKEAIFELN